MKESTKEKLYWFWEDVKEWIGDWIGLIFLFVMLGGCSSYFMFFKEEKVREPVVVDTRLYLDMVYLINCDGVAYDSAIVDYYWIDSKGIIDWESYDEKTTYNGTVLIKELPESYEEPYIREVMRRRAERQGLE